MTMLDRLYTWLLSDLKAENLPIRAGQLRARVEAYPMMVLTQTLVGVLLCAMMWDVVSHRILAGWLIVQWCLHGVEFYHWWRYRDRLNTLEECRAWRTRFVVFVGAVGALWGAAGVLMYVPGDLGHQALLVCVILGVAAGGVTLNPMFPPSLFIFLISLISPIAVMNLTVGDHAHLILGILMFVYLGFVLNAGRMLAGIFEQSLRGEWENARLAGQLVKEKARAERAQQEAEAASRAKSKFFAAANHDLRQPMHALTMFVELMKTYPLNEQAMSTVGQMERSVDVVASMLDTLLDISKLDAGVVQVNPGPFSLGELLDQLKSEFSMLAKDKGLQLEMDSCKEIVLTDPVLLERILRNLLANALRYTDKGIVRLSCVREGDMAKITVSDTGIGIAPEHLPHIFEEYFQVGNRQRDRGRGLGLGLAIVDRLAKLLGCELTVESAVGEGTRFSFGIPICAPDDMMRGDCAE